MNAKVQFDKNADALLGAIRKRVAWYRVSIKQRHKESATRPAFCRLALNFSKKKEKKRKEKATRVANRNK